MKTIKTLFAAILLFAAMQSYGQYSAGPDQVICATADSIFMSATGSGTWTAFGNNPATSQIVNPTNPNTVIKGFPVAGLYGFVWTTGSGADTMYVTVKPVPPAPGLFNLYSSCAGTAQLVAYGIVGDSIMWDNGFWFLREPHSDSIYTPTFSGPFNVRTIGANGCISPPSASITIYPSPAAPYLYSHGTCAPHDTLIAPNGNNALDTIEWWSGGQIWYQSMASDSFYVPSIPGMYTTRIVSFYGCNSTFSDTVVVGNCCNINASITTGYYTNYWTLTANPTSGTGPYTYHWSNGSGFATDTIHYNGLYTCTVTDHNGCSILLKDTAEGMGLVCSVQDTFSYTYLGANQYRFYCQVYGPSVSNPQYYWYITGATYVSGSGSTVTYLLPSGGNYNIWVHVQDQVSICTFDDSSTYIHTGACNISIHDSARVNATCGSNNGQVSIIASGGTPPYQYQRGVWGSWQNTYTFFSLPAGIDTFHISDAAGCTSTMIDTIGSSGTVTPSVTIIASQVPVCNYWLDTLYAAPVNQGPSPTYVWYINGVAQTGNNFTERPLYNPVNNGDSAWVVMTNNQSCASPHTVSSNHIYFTNGTTFVPSVTITATHTSMCPGVMDTFAATSSGGGSSPHYQWYLNGLTVASNSTKYITDSLANGDSVWVVMTSSSYCASPASASSNIIHLSVNGISVSPSSNSPVAPSGTILLLSNPVGPISSYSWIGPNGFASSSQNPVRSGAITADAGTYTVTVTNSSGCTASGSTIVYVSSCNITLTDTITAPGCSYNSGSVRIGASGGTAPYLYSNGINGTLQSSHIFSGLVAGTDTFYVKDAIGCTHYVVATLVRSGSYPTVAPTSNSPVAIGSTLSLTANATGTIASYSWTGPNGFTSSAANPSITNVTTAAGGTYHCTVSTGGTASCNANGGVNVVITGGANAGPNETVSCATLPGGSATMAAVGAGVWTAASGNPGTATITVPTSPTTTINNYSAAGVYNFIWTSGGQTDTASVAVTATPPAPILTSVGSCLGADTLIISGAPGASSFSWNLNGTSVHTSTGNYNAPYIVAGGNGSGTAANQFQFPSGIALDAAGNLYVGDFNNNRVQKFPPGSTSATNGTTVAGTASNFGSAANLLFGPEDVFVDASGNLYVADEDNNRIQKFPPGSTSATNATTVAGGNGQGTALNQLTLPQSMRTDAAGNLYVVDQDNNRVLKFPTGSTSATNGTVVAGGNGRGTAANQLSSPFYLTLDAAGNLYVADSSRVQKFPPGSTSATNGVTVAGGNGDGNAANQLYYPQAIVVDAAGNLYVADANNYRVQKFPAGSTSATNGVTVAGVGAYGSTTANQFVPEGLAVDAAGNIYISDWVNNRVEKWSQGSGANSFVPTVAGNYTATYFSAQGCTSAASNTLVVNSCSANAGPDQTVLCATLPGGSVTMAAVGTGTWTAISGNPGTATITNANSPTTTITTFTANGIYHFRWTSGGQADTADVTVFGKLNAGPDQVLPCAILPGGSVTMAGTGTGLWYPEYGPGASTITNPNSATTTITNFTDTGTYYYVWSGQGCPDTAAVIVNTCLSDSVWPGDANHNGIADNNDLLPIGTAYGLNGFPRATTSIVWQADYCQNWGVQFLNGENAKHADCNGDGVINANDTVAIMQNFGLTHSKTNGYNGLWRSGIPGITLQYSKDTVNAGDTLTVSLVLGDSLLTVSNIYGLAFTYHYDPIVVDSTSSSFGFINSFIGNNTNDISIHKDFRTTGTVMAAVTGINHTNRSGYGVIAHFIATITTGNINGKDLSYYGNINYISDITAIDKDGNPISINAGIDSNEVAYTPTGIHDISYEHVMIYPNPAKDAFTIQADAQLVNTEYSLTDVTGRIILSGKLLGQLTQVSIGDLASGLYMLQLGDHKATYKVIKN